MNDGFGSHPKTIGMSLEAVGLWTVAGAWCSRHLTDGYIPNEVVKGICRKPRVIQELADRNLWIVAPGGWQFHDWNQYQRTRAQVETERSRSRERLTRWREERRHL